MRAVWYDRQGAADEVLVCGELPTPEVGHGEVRVRLEASGVNPSDTYRRRGPPAMEYPRVVTNSDGAGVVDQVGPGVSERWLGKRVWLYNGQRNGRWQGTAAEYIALSVDLVTELPDHGDVDGRGEDRDEKCPREAEERLLVAHLHVAPDEREEQLTVVPQLAEVEVGPARCRPDDERALRPLLAVGGWRLLRRRGRSNLEVRLGHGARC